MPTVEPLTRKPKELGIVTGGLRKPFPHFTVFGGRCGTDLRHIHNVAVRVKT